MYVYCTKSFNNELAKYQDLSSRVDSFCSKLKTMNSIEAEEKFERIHSYLKRKEGSFRLIAKVIRVEKEPIICLLKLYNRGEPEYRHFLELVKHQDFLFQESDLTDELSVWLAAQQNNYQKNSTTTLEDNLRIWLQRPDWKIHTDGIVIHESELWCQRFNQQEIRSAALSYRQIVEELIDGFNTVGTKTQWSNIRLHGRDRFHIIYSNILTKDKSQVLLLVAPVLGNLSQKVVNKIIEPIFKQNTELNWWQKPNDLYFDDLITYTKRSYPWYLISDEKFWLRIQDGNGVNLALSAEETSLLHSVSTETSLPLFLNGRAGSGKSTMLFHLFAYYCNRHLQFCRETGQDFLAKPHPLFITYSPNLSDFAKVKVQSLLKHHHHFLEDTGDLEKIPNMGAFFKSFRSFLLKLLPVSLRANFTEDNYVSFHKFRELFSYRWSNLSAEKCWLVIQNFIKGYELISKDSYLESIERYQLIPKKERTVTVEEFRDIRDRVWRWYHKYTQEHQLWDDRDLVRTILDRACYKPQYTVIFCDEAQDFTRLELQLIMSLSVFSLYNLERETIFSLPFAFAGDPLQTLNPTGFRWAGFKAAFHDEVLTPLKITNRSKITLQLKQLKYNYRSAAAIVKVSNLIQLWRKILFNFTDIEPQQARKYNNFLPQKFIINENIADEHLQNALKNTIILIPCNEGAEREFIQQDELLNSFYPDTDSIPWNVLSAISAKGLEFKQVILYRFGEACTLNLREQLVIATEEDKYFLNKLYVAISRATEKLFIIDSTIGEIKLWSYASDRNYLASFLNQIDNTVERQQWQENIELITSGESLLNLGNNDVEANALTFETVGINTENISFLNRAIAAYQRLGNKPKTELCQAWKLKLERDFSAAGELFLSLYKIAEAWTCFWSAKSWDRLQQLIIDRHYNLEREIADFSLLSSIVNFMFESLTSDSIKLIPQETAKITDLLDTKFQQNELIEERDDTWQNFLDTYSDRVQQLLNTPQVFSDDYWLKIARVSIGYSEETTSQIKQLIAQSFYFGRDYHSAVKYWEDIDDELTNIVNNSAHYYIAKAKLTTLPLGLKYLYRGQQYKIILQQWLKTGATLEPAWLEYVAPTFEAISQSSKALAIYCHLNNREKIQQCWTKIKTQPVTLKEVKPIVKYYLKQQLWDDAIAFAKELPLFELQCYFVYRLAYSSLTPEQLNKLQRTNYQQFVEQHLLNSQWQEYLSVEHLGIVLEKIGSFSIILNFYERYVDSDRQQLQSFARDRWLATKQKQVDYFRSGVKLAKVQKSQQQLNTNARKWHRDLKTISLPIPVVKPISTQQPTTSSVIITGLPSNTKATTLANGIQQFQLNHLLLRIAPSIEQLAIIDLMSDRKMRLNWRKGTIQLETTTITTSADRLSFSDTQGQYSGILWRENPRLELKLNNYSQIITVKFSHL